MLAASSSWDCRSASSRSGYTRDIRERRAERFSTMYAVVFVSSDAESHYFVAADNTGLLRCVQGTCTPPLSSTAWMRNSLNGHVACRMYCVAQVVQTWLGDQESGQPCFEWPAHISSVYCLALAQNSMSQLYVPT